MKIREFSLNQYVVSALFIACLFLFLFSFKFKDSQNEKLIKVAEEVEEEIIIPEYGIKSTKEYFGWGDDGLITYDKKTMNYFYNTIDTRVYGHYIDIEKIDFVKENKWGKVINKNIAYGEVINPSGEEFEMSMLYDKRNYNFKEGKRYFVVFDNEDKSESESEASNRLEEGEVYVNVYFAMPVKGGTLVDEIERKY